MILFVPSMGEDIRTARRTAALSQARLARRARTSQAAISDYESGKRAPEPSTLARIMRAARPLPSVTLARRREQVLNEAARAGVANVRVFGSVARGTDSPDSDIDLLACLPAGMQAVDFVSLCERLEAILGTHVDLVDDASVLPDDPTFAEALAL